MYQSLEATLHDAFWNSEGPAAELTHIREFLRLFPGSTVELGCGSGRLLLPLLKEGYDITGMDNSPDMLEILKAEAASLGQNVDVKLGSMASFSLESPSHSLLIPAFTLQLLSRQEALECLRLCRAATVNGGGLYLSVFIPWAEITAEIPEGEFYLDQETSLGSSDTATCHTKYKIHRSEQTLERTHYYCLKSSKGTQTQTTQQVLQWYYQHELNYMLQLTQWEVIHSITDFTTSSHDDSDAQIFTFFCRAL